MKAIIFSLPVLVIACYLALLINSAYDWKNCKTRKQHQIDSLKKITNDTATNRTTVQTGGR